MYYKARRALGFVPFAQPFSHFLLNESVAAFSTDAPSFQLLFWQSMPLQTIKKIELVNLTTSI